MAPRSLVGEGEAWTTALQVAVAAHALTNGTAWPTWSVAADASPMLAERARGGALQPAAALVTANDMHGAYGALVLQRP